MNSNIEHTKNVYMDNIALSTLINKNANLCSKTVPTVDIDLFTIWQCFVKDIYTRYFYDQ